MSTFVLGPSDFGETTKEPGIAQLVASMAVSDDRLDQDYARELLYRLGSMQGNAFQFSPALARYFESVAPLPKCQSEVIPTSRVLVHPRQLILNTTTAPRQDSDQPWQQHVARLVSRHCDSHEIPDPLHALHQSSTESRRVEMTRSGWIREVPLQAPDQPAPHQAAFVAGGCFLFEKTGMGKTRAAIRSMQANIQAGGEHVQPVRHDPARVYLPQTVMVVVPAHVLQDWTVAIRDLWPTATTWTLHNRKSFDNLSAALLPPGNVQTTVDVVLVSRDVFFTASAPDRGPTFLKAKWKEDQTVSSGNPDINIFERVQFNTVVLDEAHTYIGDGAASGAIKYNQFDGTMAFNQSAVVIRKLAYGRSTLLISATPFPGVVAYAVNHYLLLIGMLHTTQGPVTPRPLSYEETQYVECLQYNGSKKTHPSQISRVSQKTRVFVSIVDPQLLQRAQIVFLTHCVLHTDAFLALDVRKLDFTYSDHAVVEAIDQFTVHRQTVDEFRTTRIPPYNRRGQYVEYRDQMNRIQRGNYSKSALHLEAILNGWYTSTTDKDDEAVPFGTLECSVTPTDDATLGIVQMANTIVIPMDTVPVCASDVAYLRILVAVAQEGGSIVAYVGRGYDVGMLQRLLKQKGVHVTELKGAASQLKKKQKTFYEQPRQTILLLHPLHIDGVNIPEASHIVILGEVTPTELNQVIGRATRFGRTKPLYIIRTHNRLWRRHQNPELSRATEVRGRSIV